MIKGFTTDDGVTHLIPRSTPHHVDTASAMTLPAPPMGITAHGDFRNWPEFQRELTHLINKHSLERIANLPDYVLAEYMTQCLVAMNVALLTTNPGK